MTTDPQTDRITLTRDQLAVLLAHHADVVAASLHADARSGLPELRAGVARATELLTLHANALTADVERPAVAELLDSMLTFRIEPPASVPSAPVDRERIAAALYRHEWPRKQVWQQALAMDRETFLAQADAVLAVLPAPVDRGAELRAENEKLIRWHREDEAALTEMRATIARLRVELAEEMRKHNNTIAVAAGRTVDAEESRAETARLRAELEGSRAAGQHPAADRIGELRGVASYLQQRGADLDDGGLTAAADLLRRMADEEQQPETQAEEIALLRLTVDAVEEGRRELRAENALLRAQLWTLASMLDGLHTLIATSSRDWQTYRVDAWLWAVLCGWDCEQTEHTDTCTHGALEETAAMHGWDDDTVAKARRYRAAVRAITEPAAVPEPEIVHGCPPDGSGLTPCCGRTPFELPLTDRISSEAPVTCPGSSAAVAQPGKEAQPIPCNAVHLRVHHAGHQWEPQPGMDRIPCAGYPAAAPQPEEA